MADEPVDDGGAAHLAGAPLPDIALPSTLGGEVNLSKQPGTAVIYFYPWTGRPGLADPPGWDDIPGAHGSTPETINFRDRYGDFRSIKIEVFGVSTQSTAHQRELSDRLGLPFALLSDEEFRLQKALALPTFEAGGMPYLKRLTLLVRDGRIAGVRYPVPSPETHAAKTLDWLLRAEA